MSVKGSLTYRLEELRGRTDDLYKRTAERVSAEIVDEARGILERTGRIDTGELYNSIYEVAPRRTPNGYRSSAQTDLDYAPFVEWDTVPHIIEPRDVTALHFNSASGEHFARRVHHPGTQGVHFMSGAANRVQARIEQIGDEELARWSRD